MSIYLHPLTMFERIPNFLDPPMDQQKDHGQRKHATGPTLGIGVAAVVRDFC